MQHVRVIQPASPLRKENRLEAHLSVPDGSTLTNQLSSTSSPGGTAPTSNTLGFSLDHSSVSPHLNHPLDPQESLGWVKGAREARKKKIKQRGWQHMNHLASIWMTSMLMQRGPGEEQ